MKFVLSIYGRFFFFDFARALQRNNQLNQIISSYPKFVIKRWKISNDKIISLSLFEVLRRLIEIINIKYEFLNILLKQLFSYFIYLFLPKDIQLYGFFAGNSFNSKIITKLKLKGVICIAFEGSAHVNYKFDLLSTEYKKMGLDFEMHKQQKLIKETLKEYEEADFIHVPSKFVKDSFIAEGVSNKKLIHIPYAVDSNFFKPIKIKENKCFTVLFVGGVSFRKGAHYLLEAANLLDNQNIQFNFVGKISLDFFKYIKRIKVSKNVNFIGHKKRQELPYYYSSADVFCLPSLEEGLAAAQIEAMACGLPVICSTNTGGSDLIVDDIQGYVVPIRDPEAIKDKIINLFNNRDKCILMGNEARNKTKNFYSWDIFVEKLNNKIKNAINNRNN